MHGMKLAAVAVLGVAAGSWGRCAAAESEDAKLVPEVKKLFEIGWRRSKADREEADKQYRRLRETAPGDRRIKYAYALVQLQQMKYRDAAVLVDEVLDADHGAFAIREVRLWLLLMTKQYDRAMVEMPELAKRFPKTELEGDAEKPYADAAGFLGRACGYLAGPAKDQVAAAALSQCQDRVLARLTPQRRAAFEEGRRKVKEEFIKAKEQAQADAAKAEAEAADLKKRKLAELEERARIAAGTLANERTSVDATKKELSDEIKTITEEEQRATANLRQVEIAILQLRRELPILEERIRQLLEQAEKEQDPLKKQPFLDAAARWQLNRNQVLAVVADRERRHVAIDQQRAALLQRRAVAERRLQQAGSRIAQFEKNVQKLQAERTRAMGKPVTGQTAGVRHQRRRSTALTTYVSMPVSLEAEAKRVLAWFQ